MEKRKIGILFQDDLLFPHFDVMGKLLFGISGKLTVKAKHSRIMSVLERAELEDFARRDVATLSGGQKARVSLLRMLLSEPEAVLFDEPFSSLDKPLRSSFREIIHEQIDQLNIPALLVTHDEADSCGGCILELQVRGLE